MSQVLNYKTQRLNEILVRTALKFYLEIFYNSELSFDKQKVIMRAEILSSNLNEWLWSC